MKKLCCFLVLVFASIFSRGVAQNLVIGNAENRGGDEEMVTRWQLDLGFLPPAVKDTFLHYYALMHVGEAVSLHGSMLDVPYMPSVNDHVCKHPVSGCNQACKWVEWYRWRYRAKLFATPAAAKAHKHYYLNINRWEGAGLEVFVNGQLIEEPFQPLHSSFSNKFMMLDPYLRRDGQDSIVLNFQAVTPYAKQMTAGSGLVFPADNEGDVNEMKASPYLRKPMVQYGWDIAPRRVLTGLGDGVILMGWDKFWLQLFQVYQDSLVGDLPMGTAKGFGTARWIYLCDESVENTLRWDISKYSDSALHWKENTRFLFPYFRDERSGVVFTMASESFEVDQVHLWQPNGLHADNAGLAGYLVAIRGDATSATSSTESPTLASPSPSASTLSASPIYVESHAYFRNIRLDTSNCGFAFVVNGKKVFAKGVNVVWAREFRVGSPYPQNQWVDAWMQSWKKLGVNMVRIWGGGAYPSDYFYDQCDKNGIMVWQDFMFSGTTYPQDMLFLNAVEIEVHNTVNRYFHHPSLAIWCGNNEIEVAWFNWGWQNKYGIHGADSIAHWKNYLFMFDSLIPGIVHHYMPQAPYLRSSPVGNWGTLRQMRCGDNHDWGVWHGERRFAYLDSVKMPFVSEYGLPSYPGWMQHWRVIRSSNDYHVAEDDEFYQKAAPYLLSYKGIALLKKYAFWNEQTGDFRDSLAAMFRKRRNLCEESWNLQGDFLWESMVAHRLNSPICSGSLMWQWNDIWPGITWSITHFDSFALKAPLQIEKAFAPVVGNYVLQRLGKQKWVMSIQYYSEFLEVKSGKIGLSAAYGSGLISVNREVVFTPGQHDLVIVLEKKMAKNLENDYAKKLIKLEGNGWVRQGINRPLRSTLGLQLHWN